MDMNSTIAAVSTPFGKGGVALIRISGNDAFLIAEKVFFPMSKKGLSDYAPRTSVFGRIKRGDKVIDDGICVLFPAPNSFTGENVAEITCHGGIIVTKMVLETVLANGARYAEAGEFTRRSFVNGKMTLTGAEALGELLEAKSESAALLSAANKDGRLSAALDELREEILTIVSSLSAYIDYPDEDLEDIGEEELRQRLCGLKKKFDKLTRTFNSGRAVTGGIPAVILGRANAGKSTLFNALLGEEKAIVADKPGTTRDVIEYTLTVGKLLLNLADTAGLRESDEEIENIGIELALKRLSGAELVLAVFDSSRELSADDLDLIGRLEAEKNKVIVPVLTKNDKETKIDTAPIEKLGEISKISKEDEESIEALKNRLEKLFIDEKIDFSGDAVLTTARQNASCVSAREKVEAAISLLDSGAKDLAILELEAALRTLYETDGLGVGEKVVDRIFSKFCVGK